MRYKPLPFERKSLDEQGNFTGFASVYGNIDSYGDVVMPGAFTLDLATRGKRRPLLSQHDPKESIGWVELTDSSRGLLATGQLLLDLPKAHDDYIRLKHGVVQGLSIGYETLRDRPHKSTRELLEIKLWEVSW